MSSTEGFDARDVKLQYAAGLMTKLGVGEGPLPLLQWTLIHRRELIPGRPFDLKDHPYLVALYQDETRKKVVKKGAQMGISEWLISVALHGCDQRQATVLYLFPTETHITDFSLARIGPAVEASERLQQLVSQSLNIDEDDEEDDTGALAREKARYRFSQTKKKYRRGSDRVRLKRFGNRVLYMRGAQVRVDGRAPQLKSVDADMLIIDEADEMDPRAIPIAQQRLGHSEISEEFAVSTPTWPQVGIDAMFSGSDQHVWMLQCEACGHWQQITLNHIVDEYDHLERPIHWHGYPDQAFPVCRNSKCGKPIDRLGRGIWVPRYPERDLRGYHIPRLISPRADLLAIIKKLQSPDETTRRETTNQELGEVWVATGAKLTREHLDEVRREYTHGPKIGEKDLVMGVDVGDIIYIVVRGRDVETGEWRQRWAGMVSNFDAVALEIKRWEPRCTVIDALPETHKAREIQSQFPAGKVWLAYYHPDSGTRKIMPYLWNEAEMTVTIDRTRAGDEMVGNIFDGIYTLPIHARDIPQYYSHLCAPTKIMDTHASGQPWSRYINAGQPDHYFHGELYAQAAAARPAGAYVIARASSALAVQEMFA